MKIILTIFLIILLPTSILIVHHNKQSHIIKKHKPANIKIPVINFWKTKNGTEIYFVSTANNNNSIDIQISFDAGTARDYGKPGLASLVARALIPQGNNFTTADIEKDRVNFKLKLINNKKNIKNNLLLFNFLKPLNLNILKNQLLIDLKLKLEDNKQLALLQLHKLLYDKHPYANFEFNNEDLENITTDDLVNFYNSHYVANNCIVTIVGNIKKKQAISIANLIISKLKPGSKPATLPNIYPTEASTHRITSLNSLNSNLAHIITGQAVATPYDSNYFDFIVGNLILEKQLNSEFLMYNKPGPFIVSFSADKFTVNQAIDNIKLILTNFINNGPSTEELELAKTRLINYFPMQFINNNSILNLVSYIGFYKLPINFLDNYIENLSMVTKESVLLAWQKRIRPDLMTTVIID
jgi:zinc protease